MVDESPFANFVPSTEAPTEPSKNASTNKPKKRGKNKALHAVVSKMAEVPAQPPAVANTAKKPRKVRKAKEPRKARAMKVELTTALVAVAGLTEADCQVLEHLTSFLASHPKKSRSRVIGALAKIFA